MPKYLRYLTFYYILCPLTAGHAVPSSAGTHASKMAVSSMSAVACDITCSILHHSPLDV
jgi:hypothetical protein